MKTHSPGYGEQWDASKFLVARAQELIEDFTCPLSGLPTPGREPVCLPNLATSLATYQRSLWGVSGRNALKLTQIYALDNRAPDGPAIVRNRKMKIDLHNIGQEAHRTLVRTGSAPVQAHESPPPEALSFLGPGLQPNNLAVEIFDLLSNEHFSWITPVDPRPFPEVKDRLTSVRGLVAELEGVDPGFARLDTDPRMIVATHQTERGRLTLEGVIKTISPTLHEMLAEHGAVDISKI